MKRKQQTHLRGRRGQAFADQIRGIFPVSNYTRKCTSHLHPL